MRRRLPYARITYVATAIFAIPLAWISSATGPDQYVAFGILTLLSLPSSTATVPFLYAATIFVNGPGESSTAWRMVTVLFWIATLTLNLHIWLRVLAVRRGRNKPTPAK